MRLEGLHRASITESPLCGISVATQLPHNPRLKLLRFSERRLSWRITALSEKWLCAKSKRGQVSENHSSASRSPSHFVNHHLARPHAEPHLPSAFCSLLRGRSLGL